MPALAEDNPVFKAVERIGERVAQVSDDLAGETEFTTGDWARDVLPELTDEEIDIVIPSFAAALVAVHPELMLGGTDGVWFAILTFIELGRNIEREARLQKS